MEKSILLIVITTASLLTPLLYADYLIELNNGRTIVAVDQKKENNQLKLTTQRGEVSIPMRNIKSIKKIENKDRKAEKYYQAADGEKSSPLPAQTSDQPKKENEHELTADPEKESEKYIKQLKDKMVAEKWPAKYKEWDKNKDNDDINMKYQQFTAKKDLIASMGPNELNGYMREIDGLKSDIMRGGLSNNYASELNDLFQTADLIESRLTQTK